MVWYFCFGIASIFPQVGPSVLVQVRIRQNHIQVVVAGGGCTAIFHTVLRIVRPRIFESKFRNHCAKKLDGALNKSTSFM